MISPLVENILSAGIDVVGIQSSHFASLEGNNVRSPSTTSMGQHWDQLQVLGGRFPPHLAGFCPLPDCHQEGIQWYCPA